MKTLYKKTFKVLFISILSLINYQIFAQSVLITPRKSIDSDTLSIQKKLIVGEKYASKPNNKFEVFSNNKVRLSVNEKGNVGVGTNTPSNALHAVGRTQIDGRLFIYSSDSFPFSTSSNLAFGSILSASESQDSSDLNLLLFEDSIYSPWLNFGKARGTKTSPITVQDGDDLGKIEGFAYNQDDFYDVVGISFFVDGTPTAKSMPTGMQIATTREGTTEPVTTISVRSTGNVGIGTFTPQEQLSIMKGMNIDQNNNNQGALDYGLKFGSNSGEGIASRRSDENSTNYHGLDFYTNFSNRMSINTFGNVGIGTTNPTQAKLVVNGNVNGSVGNFNYLQSGTPITGTNSTGNSYNYSIYASNRIAASEFNAFSDSRIKDIKGVSDNENDLGTLSKIEITDYEFKDKIGKGNGQHKKVIAQQIESVYPQAVNKITDCIPDIYQLTTIENSFVSLPKHNLKVGEKVKLIFDENQEIFEVLTISDLGFTVAHSEKINPNLHNQKTIFVYGHEVSDFRSVDYEALSMLNISATQALLKRLNEAEKKIIDLEKQQNKIKDFEARLSILENQHNELSINKK